MTATDHALPRLPRRYAPIVFGLVMSTLICAVTSSMIVAINTGFDAGFCERWLRSYVMAWAFAFPTVVLLAPHVRRWIEGVCE